MTDPRFSRQVPFVTKEGHRKLRATHIVVVGAGGIGSHVIQQLAFMGLGTIGVIDPDDLELSNRNRLIGARQADPIPGTPKVLIAQRVVQEICSEINVHVLYDTVLTPEGFALVREADWVIGCVDREGVRLILTELCAAYALPYIDVASEIDVAEGVYGGKVCVAPDGQGCLSCLDQIDQEEASTDLATSEERAVRDAIYGVPADDLGASGPAVVSINGVVASLACTELLVAVTGVRPPARLLTYRAHMGVVTRRADPPAGGCLYCTGVWGTGTRADVERHLRLRVGSERKDD